MAYKNNYSSGTSGGKSGLAGESMKLLRRLFSFLASPYILIPGVMAGLVAAGFLYSKSVEYSEIIDRGLRGDLFVRTSGIYAAPMNIRKGSPLQLSGLVKHLQQLGYLEQGASQNDKRGFYRVRGTTIEITPGSDAVIDGVQAFHNLRVQFGRSGNGVESITDLERREELNDADVEPELISTVTNKDREKRKIIEYKDLPGSLVDGLVAIEDRQFFEHPGINWRGIVRALIRDYQAGGIREGGSSITQQLVKNIFLFPDRTWKRKLQEAFMSLMLEQRLSKEEILTMYGNQIYLGQRGGYSINGFGQASRTYFGKDISNLSLAESALLAGIIRSPNYYSPYSNPDRALARRNMVLEKMVEAGKLDRASAESTKKLPLGIAGKSVGVNASDAPYFTDYLMRQIERQYQGDEQSLRSLRIYSTIDLNLQRAAYDALTQNMARIEERIGGRTGQTAGLQAALVAMNAKTGEVVAMIGGRDYSTSQLNRATDAKRQPGSVFKPFVYAAALELGESGVGSALTAASLFFDQPQTFDNDGKPYRPGNFGDKYENRPITVRDALVDSKNVITVEIAQRIGMHQVKLFAEKAGIQNVQPYPSAALGVGEATPLQIAAAYTAFANEGTRVAPVAVRRLTTRDGNTLYAPSPETNTVMSRPLAYIMTSIMKDVLDRGTGTQVRQRGFTGTAAGKTGSSRDAWFAGYTPNLVCVVWIGYDNNTDIGLTGGATAAPIWADFMINALKYRPDLGGEFVIPEGLTSVEIDPATGTLPQGDGIKTRTEYFLPGTSADGQPLPDSFTPDADANPETPPVEGPRPTPTPFAPARPITPASSGASPVPSGSSRGSADISGQAGNRPIPAPAPRTGPGSTGNRPATPAAASPGLVQGLIDRFNQVVNLKGLIGGALLSGWKDAPGTGEAVARPTPAPRPASRPASPMPARPATANEAPANVNVVRATPPVREEDLAESGSFYLAVCEKSGLLPVEGLCIGTVRRRFSFGKEPTRNCRSDFHR